jgi:sugar fermentation stimulation protein A
MRFPAGIYVYVGSALSGIENRVSRHRSTRKKRRWHIDYLLDKAEVVSVIAIPSERKSIECDVAKTLIACEEAAVPVKGFGSSDCGCESHLVFFGDNDPEWVAEAVTMRISMLASVYQRVTS